MSGEKTISRDAEWMRFLKEIEVDQWKLALKIVEGLECADHGVEPPDEYGQVIDKADDCPRCQGLRDAAREFKQQSRWIIT